jgi:hypothetical protein
MPINGKKLEASRKDSKKLQDVYSYERRSCSVRIKSIMRLKENTHILMCERAEPLWRKVNCCWCAIVILNTEVELQSFYYNTNRMITYFDRE